MDQRAMLSVVIPTLNAEARLPAALAPLVEGAAEGLVREVVVSDGGSEDATRDIAEAAGCRVLVGPKGRGLQLQAGAQAARGAWLLFLHADTVLQRGWVEDARRFMEQPGSTQHAAAFTFAFDDVSRPARRAAFWVGVRCRVFKLPYGDQGLLISRALFDDVGGFKPLALMEDVDIVRRIGARRMTILATRAVTSAEKYQRGGYARRGLRNLGLLARFLLGADPAKLARAYD
jgi:rSAM/selenodomain-associated transferase 2